MATRIILFILAFLLWLFLNWVPDWQHFWVGIFVAWFVASMTVDLFIRRADVFGRPRRYWRFIADYLPKFLWECLKANLDVAYRVLHPKLPIRPGIVKIKTSLKTDTALTFLANSITLTPGTLSVDVDRDNGILYVHWIDVKEKDIQAATRIVAERFERILKEIFE